MNWKDRVDSLYDGGNSFCRWYISNPENGYEGLADLSTSFRNWLSDI